MSTREDIANLSKQVEALSATVKDLLSKRDETPDQKKDREAAEAKQKEKEEEKEARQKAHEARRAAYRENNHIKPQKPRNYINKQRQFDYVREQKANTIQQPDVQRKPQNPPARKNPIMYGSEQHPWKVSWYSDATGQPVTGMVKVRGGAIWTQGAFSPAAAKLVNTELEFALGGTGYVTLHINRDQNNRTINAAALEWYAAEQTSSEADQYVTLAFVTLNGDGTITDIDQKKFDDLHIFEDMAVANGELKLVSIAIEGINYYDLPSP